MKNERGVKTEGAVGSISRVNDDGDDDGADDGQPRTNSIPQSRVHYLHDSDEEYRDDEDSAASNDKVLT
jgi:hypothetical protein